MQLGSGGEVEVEGSASSWLDSLAQEVKKGFSWWPCISSNEDSYRWVIDSESFFDKEGLKIDWCHFQIDLVDEDFHLGFDIFLEHVSSKVGDFDSVVLSFIVAGRYDNSQMFVGLGKVVEGDEGTHSEGDLDGEEGT